MDLSKFLPTAQQPAPHDPLLEFDADPAGLRALHARYVESGKGITELPHDEQRRLAPLLGFDRQKAMAALLWTPPPPPPTAAEREAARLAGDHMAQNGGLYADVAAAGRAALEDSAHKAGDVEGWKAARAARPDVVEDLVRQAAQQGPPVDALTMSQAEFNAHREQLARTGWR